MYVFAVPLLLCAAGAIIAGLRLRQGWRYGRYWVGKDPPRKLVTKEDRPKTFWAMTVFFALLLAASSVIAILIVADPNVLACDWSGACL